MSAWHLVPGGAFTLFPGIFIRSFLSGGIFSVAFYPGFPKTVNFTLKIKNIEYKNTCHKTLSKNNPEP